MQLVSKNKPTGIFETLMAQQSQRTWLDYEKDQEMRHLYVLQMTDRDTALTPSGKKESKSITSQLAAWKKTLTEDEVNSAYTFIKADDSVNEFCDYLKGKYTGKEAAKWIQRLNNEGYRNDIKRLFLSRIYDHKYKLTCRGIPAFLSGEAHNRVQELNFCKEVRTSANEAIGHFSKNAMKNPELAHHPEWVKKQIVAAVEETISKRITPFLPNRNNVNKPAIDFVGSIDLYK